MADPIFDPVVGPKWVLNGRIVRMTGPTDVIADGNIYISGGLIEAVQPAGQPPPPGFEGLRPRKTGGTIFPGLIELHNHLAYNVLPLWQVPKRYDHRGQWGEHKDYRKLISGPMNVLGKTDGLVQAVVRWTEAKALIAGTTTSQGIRLYSNADTRKYYRGVVRNVEETNDDLLPEADSKISDVDAKSAAKFLSRLESKKRRGRKLILHLAEGRNDDEKDKANRHFRALKIDSRTWAINEALVGIHCTGLRGRNFATLRARKGSVVWSPLSNLLLYGRTTDVARALDEGVPIALGSDWSPSGSKNLLMELKTARLHCDAEGIAVSDYELVRMVTATPAAMIGWGGQLGTIEAGRRADFVVVSGKTGDPYGRLVSATETSVVLVVINGVRRYGQARLMLAIGGLEKLKIGGSKRSLNLEQDNIEQSMGDLSLGDAEDRLRDALERLPDLALDLERGATASLAMGAGSRADVMVGTGASIPTMDPETEAGGSWFLDLDHLDGAGGTHRPKLTLEGLRTGVFPSSLAASVPLSELLESVELDELAAVDDGRLWSTLGAERNLPNPVRQGLCSFYGRSAPTAVTPGTLGTSMADELPDRVVEEGPITRSECLDLVEQATTLLTEGYVHLPFKRALHAVDPVQRLRLLGYRLRQTTDDEFDEWWFHNEMSRIFTSVRDLHTNYLLPRPYRAYTAVLPFQLEECFDRTKPGDPLPPPSHYLVSKVVPDAAHPTFTAGVEIINWNGVPIRRAIERNAELQAGGNEAAAFARGLDAMTVRPLITSLPPDEEWVTITYRGLDGEVRETRKDWRLVSAGPSPWRALSDASAMALGLDLQTSAVGETRKRLYAREAAEAEEAAGGQVTIEPMAVKPGHIETNMAGVFRARKVVDDRYGYLRIFTFGVADDNLFLDEFQRLIEQMPDEGLIIDVRGNGGGVITAAERLLQMLTPRHVRPSRAQFTTSPLLLDVCRRHGPDSGLEGLDLSDWVPSLEQAVATGSAYSRGYPITSEKAANDRGQRYFGPVLLIVDALSYSATDIFAAGFIDHRIGSVLGTAGNTGAGGANVWQHSDLLMLAGEQKLLKPLPRDAEMRVAVRRITRVGQAEGEVLEDLGINIPNRHYMTERDITGSNDDLIAQAIRLLKKERRPRFRVTLARRARGRLEVRADTTDIDTMEVRIGGKAVGTIDAGTPGPHRFAGLRQRRTAVEVIARKGSGVVARRRDTV